MLASTALAKESAHSASLYGALGLNTMPSARMDKAGAIRLGVSTLDPYAHSFVGFQIADPLSIVLRQTAEVSSLAEDADRLYPGLDLKLRLLQEGATHPEISIGIQSALGHKRMSGEYVAASKRFGDFDFTAGLGWGRYGTSGTIDNPLKVLAHFDKGRSLDGEMPNRPEDWFTGDQIGIFGGVEYFTPIDGLSLKFDWGADRYEAEQSALNYSAPAPWSAGLAYQPADWINIALAAQGTDKIMARLSLQGMLQDWRNETKLADTVNPMRPHRTGTSQTGRMIIDAANDDVFLYGTMAEDHSVITRLALKPGSPAPWQIGRAAVNIANNGGKKVEEITIVPTVMGFQGPSVRVMRNDFEQALLRSHGSPEEIWRNAEFDTVTKRPFQKIDRLPHFFSGLREYSFISDTQVSLAEEDNGLLYRTALLTRLRMPRFFGLLDTGGSVRLNITDNLHRLEDLRPPALLPVRSNVQDFAERILAIDETYAAFTHSFKPDLHLSLISGYLEEMYAGMGGEFLYRPFGPRFALGADAWLALKRDPNATLNLGLNGDHLLTGHVNGWYDVPNMDITLRARAGRYLAEDVGFTLGLQKTFDNGAKLEGFSTVTTMADYDLFGGTTHSNHGLRLSLPLDGFKHMPKNSMIRVKAEPFGRDTGQTLQNPIPLYELTEPFSYRHMIENWADIIPEKKEPPEGG